MYYNRRTIVKAQAKKVISPFKPSGKLRKGFRYLGAEQVRDSEGNLFNISEFK